MEASAALRSFHSAGTLLQAQHTFEKPINIRLFGSSVSLSSNFNAPGLVVGGKLKHFPAKQVVSQISCAKLAGASITGNSSVLSSPEKKPYRNIATFPNGFEGMLLEVCDHTEIAEVKLKIGDFEMRAKREAAVAKAPSIRVLSATPPPIPTKPMETSAPVSPLPSPPKSSREKISPFMNPSIRISSKLAALDDSRSKNYVVVTSPMVGSYRRGRTVKGMKQPLPFKEGDVIKEGQVIGYLDQFGTELPVKSDVGGKVLKLLFENGEAVGYGDPLIAVLPH